MGATSIGEAKLLTVLDEEISRWAGDLCAIHAGHYILSSGDDGLVENVLPTSDDDPSADFSAFTRTTWELGCELAARAQCRQQHVVLLVMVNDWQFVRHGSTDRRAEERSSARNRDNYYSVRKELPSFHMDGLARRGLGPQQILKASKNSWLFSESVLRVSLARSVAALFEQGLAEGLGLTKSFTPSGDPVVVAASALGSEMTLLFCGTTNCSGEVVELLRDLKSRGVTLFVNLYPRQCLGPVSTGTVLAKQLYGLGRMRVVNVALPLRSGESSVEEAIIDRSG